MANKEVREAWQELRNLLTFPVIVRLIGTLAPLALWVFVGWPVALTFAIAYLLGGVSGISWMRETGRAIGLFGPTNPN